MTARSPFSSSPVFVVGVGGQMVARRHNKVRLSRSVRPPSSQWMMWVDVASFGRGVTARMGAAAVPEDQGQSLGGGSGADQTTHVEGNRSPRQIMP
jgi:hypothetical protein